jgi:hypothetical protein
MGARCQIPLTRGALPKPWPRPSGQDSDSSRSRLSSTAPKPGKICSGSLLSSSYPMRVTILIADLNPTSGPPSAMTELEKRR